MDENPVKVVYDIFFQAGGVITQEVNVRLDSWYSYCEEMVIVNDKQTKESENG